MCRLIFSNIFESVKILEKKMAFVNEITSDLDAQVCICSF